MLFEVRRRPLLSPSLRLGRAFSGMKIHSSVATISNQESLVTHPICSDMASSGVCGAPSGVTDSCFPSCQRQHNNRQPAAVYSVGRLREFSARSLGRPPDELTAEQNDHS
jgi:hypothetical protein